jgi:hypothetical protein
MFVRIHTVAGLAIALLIPAVVASQTTAPGPRRRPTRSAMVSAAKRATAAEDVDGKICDLVLFPGTRARPNMVVASVDYSGRMLCSNIQVITLGAKPRAIASFHAIDAVDSTLSTILIDVDHDGDPELVVPDNWAWIGSRADCHPEWKTVYRCSKSACIDVSRRVPQFYVTELLRLNEAIGAAREVPTNQATDAAIHDAQCARCQVMERDRVLRSLGRDAHAGFQQAEEWMNSVDQLARESAVAVLTDIGDEASRQRLEGLANDPNSFVAGLARMKLAHLRRHQIP